MIKDLFGILVSVSVDTSFAYILTHYSYKGPSRLSLLNGPILYPYSIKINRCKGSCNAINDPYAKLCVPDQIKNTNVKIFNLMSRANETRHIKWHKTSKCKCRLDARICNDKQKWNDDKCRCECKKLIDKGMRDKGLIWNPSNCEC